MQAVSGVIAIAVAGYLAASFPAFSQQTSATAESATMSTAVTPEGGRIVVEAHGVQPKAPFFFSATADQVVRFGVDEITGEARLKIRVVQGRPEVITLALTGSGEVVGVTGDGLRDWAVRKGTGNAAGARFLDLRPVLAENAPSPASFEWIVRTRVEKPAIPGVSPVLLLAPGDAVGFSSQVTLSPGESVEARVTKATGMAPLNAEAMPDAEQRFSSTGDGTIEVALARRGAAVADAELAGAQLTGKADEQAGSVSFRLRAEGRSRKPGAKLRLLAGRAALSEAAAGDGWHVELGPGAEGYFLVFERAGVFPLDLAFVAALAEQGDWKRLDFQMPAGTVVPLVMEGLLTGLSFDPAASVVPLPTPQGWRGFLPADGNAALAWRRSLETGEGALFFASYEQNDVRVGAGLLRQVSQITFRILQGKLHGVKIRLDGPGEIMGVEGANVVGWSVGLEGNRRVLDVRLSRPFEKEGALLIRSQAALGNFPVRAEPLRLTPEGVVRHSGYVRVANDGAVRLEVADVSGMMQLAPAQFPGGEPGPGTRQVFVYRFPAANYAYRVVANQILPEVGVSQVILYELAETDRVITADLELDIREAPLRDWSLTIPEDYAVVSVTGNDVVDYASETESKGGARALKILFGKAVDGRQLVRVRLEKNQAAAAGEWQLPPLSYPGAKTVRGHIGVVSAPGYRIVPAGTEKLAEIPLSYFPTQTTGLQQAYRLREPEWKARVKIESLGQSVQADVFHLYSLKEGVVYGSVLINYFVVGAPSNEWRVEVPAAIGNIDVVGQNVRRDWRRDGNQIVVSLHQPILGAATLLITFEQPMSARGGAIQPGEVRPLGVQSERGFVQVVSPLQVKSQVRKAEGGLLKLEPLELPTEFRLLTSSPSLAVYQYTARPFVLEMNIEWYDPADTVDQVVDFAKLSSQISRDGQVVTDARFFVKTRGRKALRFALPPGVKLWEARADHEIVNAQADGEQTLVPLPPRMNPNEPVEVVLRLGQVSKDAARPVVQTPKMAVPTVISEWTLMGDPERLLVPRGGTAELTNRPLTQTGFEWLNTRKYAAVLLLLTVALVGSLLRSTSHPRRLLGALLGIMAIFVMLGFTVDYLGGRRPNQSKLSYSATVIPAGESATIQVGNAEAWQAMISWWGMAVAVAGLACLGYAAVRVFWGEGRAGWPAPVGIVLLSLGLLAQHGGAAAFFVFVAMGIFVLIVSSASRRGKPPEPAEPQGGGAAVVASLLLVSALLMPAGRAGAEAKETAMETGKPAEAISQTWKIREDRLFGEMEVRARGSAGDSVLLLRPPAVLTEFQGEGVRLNKVVRGDSTVYFIAPEREGVFTVRAKFEMPVRDLAKGLPLPTGPTAMQRVSVELDQGGWEFTSPMAAGVYPMTGLDEKHSGAILVLGPAGQPVIGLRPKRRDVASEATQFFAEVANLYIPGPGVVNGLSRVTIRPVQGRVSTVECDVPPGFTVGDVGNGPIGEWRFDPQSRKLRVAIEPAQTAAFKFTIESQLGTESLPVELSLEPIRVSGAAGEVGMIALAFGSDAQPENVRPSNLSTINLEDFDSALLPKTKEGQLLAILQQAYRYGKEAGKVALKVAPVAPEVRAATKQVLSLGDDRLVLAVDLTVEITRAGLFKLSFVLPEKLEVEALSGPSLNHWTEAEEGGKRIVTLHLNGRTIGSQTFSLTLTGTVPPPQDAWTVPKVLLREATRQTGEISLLPEKGIRLRAVARENVSQLDPRTSGDTRPGTLAFRLLQDNWVLKVGIEALDPWITVQGLQEVTMREGQTVTRLSLRYRVENAAVKQLRVRLPGLSETQVQTVRATGSVVSDLIKVPGEQDLWEIRFQRGIAGETDVQIDFQGQTARDQGKEVVQIPGLEAVRQTTLFVAIRGGGRLDLEAGSLPRGWQRIDWSAVPANLQDQGDRSVPALCFRVAEPEAPLAVNVRRHDVADALKLRVTQANLTTLFSPRGASLTAAALRVEIVEKSAMRVRLPKEAQLFSAFVNEQSVTVVREGDAYLFNVSPETDAQRSASVRLVYSVAGRAAREVHLAGPRLDVPLENVSWRVIVPPSYVMSRYKGGLRLKEEKSAGWFGLEDYVSMSSSSRETEAKKATEMLEKANTLLKQGDQQQAGEVLNFVANANVLDEASNEDARVQLRTLKTQQAVIGLNTRRQRLYFDNKSNESVRNEQLEQAASQNPFMQGKTNFNVEEVDKLLQGNTAEENGALRGIASRIVDQQLATEPAPGAIDVTLPEQGKVLTFTRSVQVDGDAPLTLELGISEESRADGWFLLAFVLGFAGIGALVFPRRVNR